MGSSMRPQPIRLVCWGAAALLLPLALTLALLSAPPGTGAAAAASAARRMGSSIHRLLDQELDRRVTAAHSAHRNEAAEHKKLDQLERRVAEMEQRARRDT